MTARTTQEAYDELAKSFAARNPKSKEVFERAAQSMPGGNTRTSIYYDPFPVSIARAEGARLYDKDDHEYVDILGEYTAGLYGHSEPRIMSAITEALNRGVSFGSHHEDEHRLAELVKARFKFDLLRFTNSGTEATLMALAVAKYYTGKKKVMVFGGGYHGAAFIFAGNKVNPVNAPHEYVIAKYNDISSVQELLNAPENKDDVAAIIIECMIGAGGAIPADRTFLQDLRREATKAKAVLIFDEVMTSRLYEGAGVQSQLPEDMRPDLTTLGKYVGGGMSFGAFGGKREIMELFDPRKPNHLQHAGTFNNNVLTMAAGRVGLEQIFTPDRAKQLHARGDKLRVSLQEASRGSLLKVTGLGSLMCFHFIDTPVEKIKSPDDTANEDKVLAAIFHLFLLEKGYYISRRGYIALSLALGEPELTGFYNAVVEFLQTYRSLLAPESENSKM
jgi:glutamate-1-semialdehyde 2,1-aminomutase